MSNKKLSQLTEKVTSLSADDLLYVSVNGESKSIRASVVEAPLKAYADQKKSEVITELVALDDKIETEISARASGDSTVQYYATAYTDQEIQTLSVSVDADIQSLEASIAQTYTSKVELQAALDAFEIEQNDAVEAIRVNLEADRISGDDTVLQSANAYTDAAIAGIAPSGGSPVGVILMFAGTTAPTGYLLCDGSAISRSTYSSLFSVISTSFGSGDGSTTFNLPNPDGNANLRYIIKF